MLAFGAQFQILLRDVLWLPPRMPHGTKGSFALRRTRGLQHLVGDHSIVTGRGADICCFTCAPVLAQKDIRAAGAQGL